VTVDESDGVDTREVIAHRVLELGPVVHALKERHCGQNGVAARLVVGHVVGIGLV
jgi:hypothetical protein